MEKRIKMVKEEHLVFNLIPPEDLAVTYEALAVLSYGEGFVPTPKFDREQFRLQAFNAKNKLEKCAISQAKKLEKNSNEEPLNDSDTHATLVIPSELRLRRVCLPPANEHGDPLVTEVVNGTNEFANTIKPKKAVPNLGNEERIALTWLKDNTQNKNLAVLKADKGGAKVLLKRDQVNEMIKFKLQNQNLYTDMGPENPMPAIMKKLRDHWVTAVKHNHISMNIAWEVVGVTESMINGKSGRPSTLDIYKPGTPFFNVYPKVHKLKIDELIPVVEVPFRLVTNLSKGPTSRADKFVPVNYLQQLQQDYCADLIQDSTMFLQKLDAIEKSVEIKNSYLIFNMDVEALYDSIKREHVTTALRHTIGQCRKTWEENFIEWLLYSVELPLDAAVAKFGGKWYQASGGVATGGKLCVYIANVVVFWAFYDVIYSRPNKHLIYFYRFIDDGTGGWPGEPIQFFRWFCHIYRSLKDNYNLKLTFNIRYYNNFLEFLDVNYRFVNNVLDTDVNYKDTDVHRYLSYLSTHPPHTFKSVIYSSFLRLWRIVIDQNLLEFRLLEMHSFLKASDYPDNLLCSIRNDVFSKERDINYRNRATDRRCDVGWVTTFGPGYGEVKKLISRINRTLLTSPLFSEIRQPVLGVVSRRAPNLRDILFSQRNMC